MDPKNEQSQEQMASTLQEAGQKAEKQKKEARAKAVKGAHLSPQIQERLSAAGFTSEDRTGFQKYSGPVKGKVLYLASNGGRVDLSGFSVEHGAVTQISAEQAKEKHLGKVRGQLDFEQSDEQVLAALDLVIAEMKVPFPEVEKPKKAKEPKAESTEASTDAPATTTAA